MQASGRPKDAALRQRGKRTCKPARMATQAPTRAPWWAKRRGWSASNCLGWPAAGQVAKGSGVLGKSAEIAKKGDLLALEGAAMGAAQPVTGDGSYGSQKALQVGAGAAAAPALGRLVRALAGRGRIA